MNSLMRLAESQFLNDRTDLLFKDLFDSALNFTSILDAKFNYPVDIKETNEGIEISIAAIGLNKEDIEIITNNNMLRVKYNKQEVREDHYIHK